VVKFVHTLADTPARLAGADNEIDKGYGLTTSSSISVLYWIAAWRFNSFPYSKNIHYCGCFFL